MLSGLLGTLPLIWDNLTYWAQLLLLIVTTFFLIYAANYSEKFEDKSIFIFKSSERVSSVLYLISTISFGSVAVFTVNIINRSTNQSISEDFQIMIVSFFVIIYSLYLYTRTRQIFQHVALFYSTIFFLGSVGNIIFVEFLKSNTEATERDRRQSGNYMIKELCHHFDANQSLTSMTLIRDTFGEISE